MLKKIQPRPQFHYQQSPNHLISRRAVRRRHYRHHRAVTPRRSLSFQNHINSVVRSCNIHMWALRHIRRSLTLANTVRCSTVNTRLDYCNSLVYGVAETHLRKLQRIQNKLVQVVCDDGNSRPPHNRPTSEPALAAGSQQN